MVAYSFKKRFVEPIRWGLGLGLDLSDECAEIGRPKRQTIRAEGKRRHARPGETLQLYTAMRTKQCRKLGDARCIEVLPVRIDVAPNGLALAVNGKQIRGKYADEFALDDGFRSLEDMHAFWKAEHGVGFFVGFLIRWEPIDGNVDKIDH